MKQPVAWIATVLLAASAHAGTTGFFTIDEAWPSILNGSTVDGGLLVNVDADPELELVQVVGAAAVSSQVVVRNLDGTAVPGWPQTINNGTFSAPAFGDIDGDGEGEIVVNSFFFGLNSLTYAFNLDGSWVSGFPVSLGGNLKAPALGNIDADPELEVILAVNSGNCRVYALNGDASVVPGFPVVLDDITGSGPAIGDIDNDGFNEICVCSFSSLYAIEANGAVMPGFPFAPPSNHKFNYTTPVLADLDDDGTHEIITSTSQDPCCGGRVYVVNHLGQVRPGWPRLTDYAIFVPVSVADITGDGSLDIAVGDTVLSPEDVNEIIAWDKNGTPLPGFPIGPIPAIHAQIMIADVDGDGDVELLPDNNIAGSDLMAYHHDGTPVLGWPQTLIGSAFQQSPSFGDVDNDGAMDMTCAGNMIQEGQSALYIWKSKVPWTPASAPLPTYQYDLRRSGVVPAPGSLCTGDIDGSGAVDILDLLSVLSAWGPCAGCPEDLNGDDAVDVLDLLDLLAAWGACR